MHQKTTISNYIFFPDWVVTWQPRQHMDVLVGSPGHYHLQNTAHFLASNSRHCMIIVSINYSLSLSLSLYIMSIICHFMFYNDNADFMLYWRLPNFKSCLSQIVYHVGLYGWFSFSIPCNVLYTT